MQKRTLSIIFFIVVIFLNYSLPVFAQQRTDSNTVRTRVGNPKNDSDIITVGMNIKNAYDSCESGYTFDNSVVGDCLRKQLSLAGYDDSKLDAFEKRRKNSIADGCTQCLGYVGLVLTLLSGSTETLSGIGAASSVTQLPNITAGSITFSKVSVNEPLLPGDIGAHDGGFGHILIVKDVQGDIKFTALESNGNATNDKVDCKVTDYRPINRDGYVFFRKN